MTLVLSGVLSVDILSGVELRRILELQLQGAFFFCQRKKLPFLSRRRFGESNFRRVRCCISVVVSPQPFSTCW